jgi:beta-lactamase superfamily II metal-dependent hydrolase
MKVHIFDVEHGECSAIETPTGELVLIGLGHNSSTGWRPSAWARARGQRPSQVVLTNLDRDHLSDIDNFQSDLRPTSIKRNNNVNADWVEALKIEESGEVHPAVGHALHWMREVFTGGPSYDLFGFDERTFFHHSPDLFQDTNNLSVVTFIRHNGVGIMFPGDMEEAGWRELLKDGSFVECLKKTNIFVASHHGRIGGYCTDIFNHCTPDVVIISDKPVVHDTQNHDEYSKHSKGLIFPSGTRKVLTTRCDGKMTIEILGGGRYSLSINQ